MKMRWMILLAASLAFAQEEELDPSVFDGSKLPAGGEQQPQNPGTPGAEPGEEEAEIPEGPLVTPGEGAPGEKTEEPPGEGQGSVPAPAATATPGAEKAGTEGQTAPTSPPGEKEPEGVPVPGAGSRAGETFRPSERIAPDHAVDLPWDI